MRQMVLKKKKIRLESIHVVLLIQYMCKYLSQETPLVLFR